MRCKCPKRFLIRRFTSEREIALNLLHISTADKLLSCLDQEVVQKYQG